MKIAIAQKIRPFSHAPGAACLIPGTTVVVEAFPALIRFHGIEHRIQVNGAVSNFTLIQDLEKNCVFISGKDTEKFYRYRLKASDGVFELFCEKSKKKQFFPASIDFYLPPIWERLSLGSHKAQEWDLVTRRLDLKEILPVLFGLGQKIPPIAPQPVCGTACLLNKDQLKEFCQAAFSQILIPSLEDQKHLGTVPFEPISGNPFFLIQEASRLIRSLFFQQNERRLIFLPSNPFDAGRLIHLQVPGVGEIDLEWASLFLRRLIIRSSCTGEVVLEFPKEVKSFRLTNGSNSDRKKYLVSEPLLLEAGTTYFFDNFQK